MSQILHTINEGRLRELFSLLLRGENVTTLWLPGGGRTRFGLALQNSETLNRFIPDKAAKRSILFIYLDYTLDHMALESQLKDVLSDYTKETRKREMLRDVIMQGYRIVLVLDNYTHLKPETSQFLFSIKSVNLDAITFLIFQLESDFAQSTSSGALLESSTHAFHNVIRMPYMTPADAKHWIKERAESLELKVDNKLIDKVFSFAGGVPVLIKNLLRGLKRYGTVDATIASIEMQNILYMFWSSFKQNEQQLIRGIRTGSVTRETEGASYLFEHNLADDQGLIGNWLDCVARLSGSDELRLEGEYIIWGVEDVSSELSRTEELIVRKLVAKKEIGREDIADIIWEDEKEDKYSDWAIDKAMSRIRTKLSEKGVPKSYIKTIRKQGYRISD